MKIIRLQVSVVAGDCWYDCRTTTSNSAADNDDDDDNKYHTADDDRRHDHSRYSTGDVLDTEYVLWLWSSAYVSLSQQLHYCTEMLFGFIANIVSVSIYLSTETIWTTRQKYADSFPQDNGNTTKKQEIKYT